MFIHMYLQFRVFVISREIKVENNDLILILYNLKMAKINRK